MAQSNPWNLFGFDLRQLGALWQQGWEEAARWPVLRRLFAPRPVLVLHADGHSALHSAHGESTTPAAPAAAGAGYLAVEVPADEVLFHRFHLPLLSRAEIDAAVQLQVMDISPFAADDSVFGWRSDALGDGRLEITAAITTHGRVEAALARLAAAATLGADAAAPEVWAFERVERPVVLAGFGEARRQADQRRALGWALGLMACALMLALFLIASPVLQARQQVFDAQHAYAALQGETQQVVSVRDGLMTRLQRIDELHAWLDGGVAVLPLLEKLTRLLPDDAYLVGLEIRDQNVIASGRAVNAAQIIEVLSTDPAFVNVRSSGISRDRGTGLEAFRIEFGFAPAGGGNE